MTATQHTATTNAKCTDALNSRDPEVHYPSHYQTPQGIEAIQVIEAFLSPEEYRGYLRGSVLKYMLRCTKKGKTIQDIQKAAWYNHRLEAAFAAWKAEEEAYEAALVEKLLATNTPQPPKAASSAAVPNAGFKL